MSQIAIQVDRLSKIYRLGHREPYKSLRDVLARSVSLPFRRLFSPINGHQSGKSREEWIWALKDVSFEVENGEVIGIIGKNGAGKSTLLKILSRITRPTKGCAWISGRVGSLLEVGTGFHPELTGRENIYLNGAILGMKKTEIDRKFDEIVAFSEMEKFLDTPVKRYSSGMHTRLAFAVAAHLEAEILIVDEVLAVGDVAFQKKCLGKMGDVAHEGRTVFFVSHNMNAIKRLCKRALLLEQGRLLEDGETSSVVENYLQQVIPQTRPGDWIDVSALHRFGSGKARVTKVRYSGDHSSPGLKPHSGGPLEIQLQIDSMATLGVGSVAISLYDKNGTKLITADTVSRGQKIQLMKGRNILSFRIHQVHLNPGEYLLGWWIHDPFGYIFDLLDSGMSIEVVELKTTEFVVQPKQDGLIPCTFEIHEVDLIEEG